MFSAFYPTGLHFIRVRLPLTNRRLSLRVARTGPEWGGRLGVGVGRLPWSRGKGVDG
jgi:hypothetical protein